MSLVQATLVGAGRESHAWSWRPGRRAARRAAVDVVTGLLVDAAFESTRRRDWWEARELALFETACWVRAWLYPGLFPRPEGAHPSPAARELLQLVPEVKGFLVPVVVQVEDVSAAIRSVLL